ncbi:MAG: YDG domain-containing protein [Clostridia bacterium]
MTNLNNDDNFTNANEKTEMKQTVKLEKKPFDKTNDGVKNDANAKITKSNTKTIEKPIKSNTNVKAKASTKSSTKSDKTNAKAKEKTDNKPSLKEVNRKSNTESGYSQGKGGSVQSSYKDESYFGAANGKKPDPMPIIPAFIPPIAPVMPYTLPINTIAPEPNLSVVEKLHDSVIDSKPIKDYSVNNSGDIKAVGSNLSGGSNAVAAKSESKGGGVFLWVILLGVAALLIAIAFGGSRSLSSATANIEGAKTMRVGEKFMYKAKLSDATLNLGENLEVVWTVNDKIVKKSKASDKNAMTFEYVPEKTGSYNVGVKIGDYGNLSKTIPVVVNKPMLSITMDSHKITYGDKIPDYTYKVDGLRNNDTIQSLKLNLNGAIVGDINKTGKYPINLKNKPFSDKYDIDIKTGNLEITPRNVTINNKAISKVYDGFTHCTNCENIKVDGALSSDNVSLNGDFIFSDKNVGINKPLKSLNCQFTGDKNSCYKLNNNKLYGSILPKQLKLSQLTAANKIFDGNINVTFNFVGTLEGIVAGDQVAIGEIIACFENAAVGKNKTVIIKEIKLVGKDSANYTIIIDKPLTADINKGIF